jgi:hypothetical protein
MENPLPLASELNNNELPKDYIEVRNYFASDHMLNNSKVE